MQACPFWKASEMRTKSPLANKVKSSLVKLPLVFVLSLLSGFIQAIDLMDNNQLFTSKELVKCIDKTSNKIYGAYRIVTFESDGEIISLICAPIKIVKESGNYYYGKWSKVTDIMAQ